MVPVVLVHPQKRYSIVEDLERAFQGSFDLLRDVEVVSDGTSGLDVGGSADVYAGEYHGQKVALKRPRISQNHERYEWFKNVSARLLVCVILSEIRRVLALLPRVGSLETP